MEAKPVLSGGVDTNRTMFIYELDQQLTGPSRGKTLTFKVRSVIDAGVFITHEADFDGKAKSLEQLQPWLEAPAFALKHLPAPTANVPVW